MVLVIYVQQMDNKDTTIIIHINTQCSGCHAYHIEEQKLLPVFLKSAMVGNYTPTVAPGAANYHLGNIVINMQQIYIILAITRPDLIIS